MSKTIIFIWVLSFLLITSCIDELELPIRNEAPKLVVEGLITNEKTPYTVKLTYTGAFLSSKIPPASLAVSGALVTISDDTGESVVLKPILQEPGVYRTADSSFVGETGRSYTLTIVTPEGKMFRSNPELLMPVPDIEKLTAIFARIPDPSQPSGYRVYVDTKDPVETENYYRWTAYGYSRRESTGFPLLGGGICCSNCWIPIYNDVTNIFSDNHINGNRIQDHYVFFAPYYAIGQQFVEVSQFSISREAFQFWKRFEEQRTRVGSIFDPLPAPIEGNVVNVENPDELALGFFSASGITRKRMIISADTLRLFPDYYKEFIKPGDCRFAYPFASFYGPSGW